MAIGRSKYAEPFSKQIKGSTKIYLLTKYEEGCKIYLKILE